MSEPFPVPHANDAAHLRQVEEYERDQPLAIRYDRPNKFSEPVGCLAYRKSIWRRLKERARLATAKGVS